MTFTYKFYRKAEDASPCTTESFEGASEQDVKQEVIAFCDIYGCEAFTLISQKKEWTEAEIKNLVQTNDKVLYGALKKLYAQQTADEQRDFATKERNNAGFNGVDAHFLTSVAEFLISKGFLTDRQKAVTRKKLVKYTRQLTRLANA